MKKTIIVMSALIFGCATVKAQKVSFGVKAGVQQNTFTMRYESDDEWQRNNITGAGFHVGGLADISLANHISVQPAVLFNSKSTVYSSEGKIKMNAIDVPINFLYKTSGFFVGLGPNLSYGISAKTKMGDETQNWYEKYPVGEGDEEKSMLKRFEIGANLTMGYQFKNNILVSTSYTQGVGNISGVTEGEFGKIRTRQIGLSIGYFFGK